MSDDTVGTVGNNANRGDKYARMAEAADAKRAQEIERAEAFEQGFTPEGSADEEVDDAPLPDDVLDDDPLGEHGIVVKDGQAFGKIVIDGEEQLVPVKDVLKGYQAQKVSTERFEAASRLRAEAAQMYQQVLDSQQNQKAEGDEEIEQRIIALEEEIDEHALAGETEEARQKRAEVLRLTRQLAGGNVDVRAAVEQTFNQKEKQRAETEKEKAVAWFQSEYNDVYEDTAARAVANQKTIELQREDPTMDPREILKQAGEYARERLGLQTPHGNEEGDSRQRRRQAMRNVDSAPNAASVARRRQAESGASGKVTEKDLMDLRKQTYLKLKAQRGPQQQPT